MQKFWNRLVLVACCLGAGACHSPVSTVVIPTTVLPKDSMVSLLVDLHLLEAGIDQGMVSGATNGTPNSVHPVMYYRVFETHHCNRAAYDSSMIFYSAHPELLSKIYEKVIAELSRKQVGLK